MIATVSQSHYKAKRGMLALRIASLFCSVAVLAGCKESTPTQKPYVGLTDPIDKVIAAINANNARIPTLRSALYFEGDIVDEKGGTHFVNANGTVLYRRAQELRLVTTKVSTGDVFDMGCNGQSYWLKSPQLDTMYWGQNANIGKPCVRKIPIRPDLILDVLGVGPIDTDLLRKPFPVMRFNNDARVYMMEWVAPSPAGDRYIVQKEVWYDLETKHAVKVILYDPNGRVVLRANLSDFKPVPIPKDHVEETDPMMATVFQLRFPDNGTTMTFTLKDPALTGGGAPNERSFRMPDPRAAGVGNVIQLDADCGNGMARANP